jgi:hypothetical protein
MTTQTLTAALEQGDPDAIAAAFDPDVSFQTPVHTEPLRGREMALQFFGQAEQVVQGLTYYDSVEDDHRTLMFWRGQVSERPIEGTTLITVNSAGLVSELAVLMRSWAVVGLFRDAMLRALADVFPLPLWELRGEHAAVADPDAGAGRPPARELAPSVRFHSPMLTKTVSGVEEVHTVHTMIAEIQGPRLYHWRIRSESRIVEFWSCAIEGHWQHGIDRLELDEHGRIEDQKVWLAPWPTTTLLRDRAIAAQLPILGPELWLPAAHAIPLA